MFHLQECLATLPIMGNGMAGIFIVAFAIFISIALLAKAFPQK